MRLFVAIPLAPPVRRVLREVQRTLAQTVSPDAFRWVREEQMHLTLVFLGKVPDPEVPTLRSVFKACRPEAGPFRLQLGSIGAFPSLHRVRVVWAGLNGECERLLNLRSDVERQVSRFGEAQDPLPFHPHLTLARVGPGKSLGGRAGRLLTTVPAPKPIEWTVEELHLIQSQLSPTGAQHSTLEKLAF